MADDLIERRIDEARELDLGDRAEPGGRHADRDAADRELGERRVDHPVRAEALEQALGRAEHAAVLADVLAQHHDARVLARAWASAMVTAPTMWLRHGRLPRSRRDRPALAGERRRQLGVEMVEHRLGPLSRRRQVALDRGVDLPVELVDQALLVGLGPHAGLAEKGAQARDRVVRPCLLSCSPSR